MEEALCSSETPHLWDGHANPLAALLGPGLQTHLVIPTLIRSSTCVINVTFTFSSPARLEGAPFVLRQRHEGVQMSWGKENRVSVRL